MEIPIRLSRPPGGAAPAGILDVPSVHRNDGARSGRPPAPVPPQMFPFALRLPAATSPYTTVILIPKEPIMGRSSSSALVVIPLVAAACGAGENMQGAAGSAVDTAAVVAQVTQVRSAWRQAALAHDVAGVGALYTDDAIFVGADGQAARGRAAIQEALAPFVGGMSTMELTDTHTVAGVELASDMGIYAQTLQTPDGGEQTMSGSYLVVLRRQADGSWKIVQQLSALPAEMPAPGGDGT